MFESDLFFDPQQAPFCPCPVCGGECYAPGYTCIRCGGWEV